MRIEPSVPPRLEARNLEGATRARERVLVPPRPRDPEPARGVDAGHVLRAPAPVRAATETLRAARGARIGTGDMRREMARLLETVETLAPDPRTARIAAWVVRGELRKLEVLDGFVGGFIRG